MGVALLTHREWLVQHVDAMPPGMQDVDLSLVDSLVVPASLHDVDGRFVHLNAAAERAIGFSRAQLLYADGKLIVLDEDGHLGLANVSPDGIKVLARASILDHLSWTPPTLSGTILYARDRKTIAAFQLGA